MKVISLSIIIFLLCYMPILADHNQYLFDQANILYEKENYSTAIEKYEEIIKSGYESWELYFNLGNAYFKNKQLGKAILNYERAQLLSSKNEDIKFNLEIANLSVIDKIVTPPEFFVFKAISDFINYFNINVLSIIVISLYIFMITIVILWLLIRGRVLRKLLVVFGLPLVILLVIFTTVLLMRIHGEKTEKYGIILVEKIDVLSSPDSKGTELFSLHEGVRVQAQKKVGEWLQIRLHDGKVGWVRNNVLEII